MKQAKMIPRIRLNTKFSSYLNYIINFFSPNKKREEFESMLKKFLNVKNLFLVSQGRVALFNILKVCFSRFPPRNKSFAETYSFAGNMSPLSRANFLTHEGDEAK